MPTYYISSVVMFFQFFLVATIQLYYKSVLREKATKVLHAQLAVLQFLLDTQIFFPAQFVVSHQCWDWNRLFFVLLEAQSTVTILCWQKLVGPSELPHFLLHCNVLITSSRAPNVPFQFDVNPFNLCCCEHLLFVMYIGPFLSYKTHDISTIFASFYFCMYWGE